MVIMKFLWHCLTLFVCGILSPPYEGAYWWEFLTGILEIVSVIVIFVLTTIFWTWYYAIAITLGYIAFVCIVATIIEKLY